MGTISIEEYAYAGTEGQRDLEIADLKRQLAVTEDATTSTTPESVALNAGTRVVSIYAVEKHRVCVGTDTTVSKYAIIQAGERRDFGVEPDETLYYRLDA